MSPFFVFLSAWGPVLQNKSALFKEGHPGATRSPQQRETVCAKSGEFGACCGEVWSVVSFSSLCVNTEKEFGF